MLPTDVLVRVTATNICGSNCSYCRSRLSLHALDMAHLLSLLPASTRFGRF